MEILTERCTIREFVSGDIGSFMEYRNDMDWMRYQGFKGMSRKHYETELLNGVSLEKGKQLAIVNSISNQLLGDIYLKKEGNIYWIGYTIHPSHARKGYAKEAVAAVMNWVAKKGGEIMKAGVLPGNTASINLLKSLKFLYVAKVDEELLYTYKL